MTIDEAIEELKECDSYQVAEWLEELKIFQELYPNTEVKGSLQKNYEQGRADMKKEIEEHSVFYSNRPIEDIVLEARNDAIDKCIKFVDEWDSVIADALARNIKEQKNDR